MKLLTSLFLLFCSLAVCAQSDSTVIYLTFNKDLTYDSAARIIADKKVKFAEKFELVKLIETSPSDCRSCGFH